MRRSINVTGKSLQEVWYDLRIEHQIPPDAEFDYDGCGTHEVSLEWDDGQPVPQPPPPTDEELAQEAADREAGF